MVSLSVPSRRALSGLVAFVSVTLTAGALSSPATGAASGPNAEARAEARAQARAETPPASPTSDKRDPVYAYLFGGTFVTGDSDTTGESCATEGNQTSDDALVPGNGEDVFLASSKQHTIDGGGGDLSTFDIDASSRVATTVRQDVLRSFSFSVKASLAGDVPLAGDSDCDINARGFGQLDVDATYPPGFLTLRMVITDTADGYFAIERGLFEGFSSVPPAGASVTEATGFVDGSYAMRLQGRAAITRPEITGTSVSSRGSVRIVGSYVGIGEATSKARGSGRRFVTLAKSRSCGANTVKATITRKKRRIDKLRTVVVKVNGKRAARVEKPTKGRTITITEPAPAKAATITATVTQRNGKKHTVTRSYAACSD